VPPAPAGPRLRPANSSAGSRQQPSYPAGTGAPPRNYCASKAGLANLSKTAAAGLGRYGIRVNLVAPGAILTPLAEGTGLMHGRMAEEFHARTPLGKSRGIPADVAGVVSFLCSEDASWMTGDTLHVDGGNHIRGLHSYWDTLHPPK